MEYPRQVDFVKEGTPYLWGSHSPRQEQAPLVCPLETAFLLAESRDDRARCGKGHVCACLLPEPAASTMGLRPKGPTRSGPASGLTSGGSFHPLNAISLRRWGPKPKPWTRVLSLGSYTQQESHATAQSSPDTAGGSSARPEWHPQAKGRQLQGWGPWDEARWPVSTLSSVGL